MNAGRWARIALLLTLVAGVTAGFLYRDQLNFATLDAWIKQAGLLGPLMFMTIYALATVLFLPGSVLTLAGGALFGPVAGTFYNLTGATIGATFAFFVARYLASDWVAHKAGGRLKQIIEGVEKEGWRFVAFTRLVPLFPFFLLNYALGLTRIRVTHYVIATYVFMLPGAFAYTYLGYAGREAITGGGGMIQKGLLALALLAVVAFLPRFIRRLRKTPDAAGTAPTLSVKELKQRLDTHNNVLVLDVRSAEEYHGPLGHIAGSRHIAISELPERLAELEDYRDRTIAVVCHTDRRSAKAMEHMRKTGFENVLLVPGGMEAWNREGLPVER